MARPMRRLTHEEYQRCYAPDAGAVSRAADELEALKARFTQLFLDEAQPIDRVSILLADAAVKAVHAFTLAPTSATAANESERAIGTLRQRIVWLERTASK